ncbi:NAD(P)-dependent dehydrogenase (short-subunit alcohol dehydrogenase family) [Brachybacterium aquaticum]|uniref:NAD(P)-dependent dehydrogenase (Short-subunit alcohol dehydrogenase family) n=1 Tax=Brachybacterium aquaticum TaxID=1432564 RepID=A0A841AAI1_9MICO|nr:NAD(P)-dependent dehydrogenase (short-subunit alcohol dehydrogenase family) [Brachybacterium aquaticum]
MIADDLNGQGPDSARAVGIDVTDTAAAEKLVASVIEDFGGVDVLVANAGVFPFAPIADMDADMLRTVFDINVVGVHNFLRPVTKHMVESGRKGKIVITLSIDALHPSAPGLGAYDTSKHALYGYMRMAALEYAEASIMINGLAPGGILTPGVTGGADTTELIENSGVPVGRWGEYAWGAGARRVRPGDRPTSIRRQHRRGADARRRDAAAPGRALASLTARHFPPTRPMRSVAVHSTRG